VEDQEILRLSGWEELTPRELAKALGISQVAARSRLHRARQRLRTALRREAEPDDAPALCLQEAR
jgi:RNA polymerase sigma-70 factor (ECF subfamily)